MVEEECMMLRHSRLQTKGASSAANLFQASRQAVCYFWRLGLSMVTLCDFGEEAQSK